MIRVGIWVWLDLSIFLFGFGHVLAQSFFLPDPLEKREGFFIADVSCWFSLNSPEVSRWFFLNNAIFLFRFGHILAQRFLLAGQPKNSKEVLFGKV